MKTNLKIINFMPEKMTSYDNENDEFGSSAEKIDYKNLMNRLKKISEIITLLEKKYLDKL